MSENFWVLWENIQFSPKSCLLIFCLFYLNKEELIQQVCLRKYIKNDIFNGIPEFLGSGRKNWTLDSERWTLKTLKTLEARLWTLGIGCWILDVKTLRFTVNPFQANVLFLFNHLKISKTRGFQRFSDDMESELQLEMN